VEFNACLNSIANKQIWNGSHFQPEAQHRKIQFFPHPAAYFSTSRNRQATVGKQSMQLQSLKVTATTTAARTWEPGLS
jgi:hypothetical protein